MRKTSKSDFHSDFHFDSLWLPLVLVGIGLLAKPSLSKLGATAKPPATVETASIETTASSMARVPASKANATKKPKILQNKKATEPLPKRPAISVSPAYSPALASVSTNTSDHNEVLDIELDAHREQEFLTKKVGLNEIQIEAMTLKRKMFLNDLQKIGEMEKLKIPDATDYKQSVVRKHLLWMKKFIGEENYREYLDLTTRS